MKDLSQSNCDVNLIDRIVEIERLANLEPIDYEAARGPASERLGVRTSVLDNEVKKKRRELRLDNANGRPLALPDVMPWPDEIEGDRIASALSATFKRYVRMSDAQANLCALWVLLTWTLDKFSIAPRLCGDYAEDISDFDPDMGGLINRVADNQRYLSPDPQDPPYETLQRYNTAGMGTSCTFQNATAKPHVAVQKCDKPPSNGHRSDVAVRKPENALARDEAADRVQKCDQCGQGGANLEVAYGTAHGFVHRGPCETAWIADRDDDLTIPAYLNRRAEAR